MKSSHLGGKPSVRHKWEMHRACEQQSSLTRQKKPAHNHSRAADSQSEHSAPFYVNYLAQHIQQICGRRLLSQGQDGPQHLSEVA